MNIKTLLLILGVIHFSYSQDIKSLTASELKNYAHTVILNFNIESESNYLLIKFSEPTEYVDELDCGIYITDQKTQYQIIDILDTHSNLDKPHSYLGFYLEQIDSISKTRNLTKRNKLFVSIEYRPYNDEESIYIVIYDQNMAKKLVENIADLINERECFVDLMSKL